MGKKRKKKLDPSLYGTTSTPSARSQASPASRRPPEADANAQNSAPGTDLQPAAPAGKSPVAAVLTMVPTPRPPFDSQCIVGNVAPQPEPELEPEPEPEQARRALRLWLADHRHCTATAAAPVAEALEHFFDRTGEFRPDDVLGILQEMGDDAAVFISGVVAKHSAGDRASSSVSGSPAETSGSKSKSLLPEAAELSEAISVDRSIHCQPQPELHAAGLDSEGLRVAVGRDRQRLLGMLQDAKPSLKKVKQTLKKLQQYSVDYVHLGDAADWLGDSYINSSALGRSELRNSGRLADGEAKPILCVGCGDGKTASPCVLLQTAFAFVQRGMCVIPRFPISVL